MLSGIYIKGFKTFARPVRMPLEDGVTAIVGPNGSGKSNITDAVLFALGEQSPGVLRAGTMSDLIFSGSETLGAAAAAEVTLVLDNAAGEISLPYAEVSLTRRISRAGETEYRINGSRARLQDLRAVAGEAGIGRHSILRQGAVDAIVAGGAAACRLALEEAAGLGVYRRRRVSATRRLEKADSQLQRSRELEAELANQLSRLAREAADARAYREIEARYRQLSLAHLYRAATRDLHLLERRLGDGRSQVTALTNRGEALRAEEEVLARESAELEEQARSAEEILEEIEDAAEGLRGESLRVDRNLFRYEAGSGGNRRRAVSRAEEELRRLVGKIQSLEVELPELDKGHAADAAESSGRRRVLAAARQRAAEVERERSRLDAEVEALRARLSRAAAGDRDALEEEDLQSLASATADIEGQVRIDSRSDLAALGDQLRERIALIEARVEDADRRRGALAAAIGRAEARVRALHEAAPRNTGTRLYEVIRPRAGFEAAVQAALGQAGSGVLAENVDAGLRLLSGTDPVAVRLDAGRVKEDGPLPGKPLIECVEVLEERYGEAVERLLGGIYVTERSEWGAAANGYVAVTRDGVRLTRTTVSMVTERDEFAREARLTDEMQHLDALKRGPGEALYDLRERISAASLRLDRLAATSQLLSGVADRARRTGTQLARDIGRRRKAASDLRENVLQLRRQRESLAEEERQKAEALSKVEARADPTEKEAREAAQASAAAEEAAEESGRRARSLRTELQECEKRRDSLGLRLARAREAPERDLDRSSRIAGRAAGASVKLAASVRSRRSDLRATRSRTSDAYRSASAQRNDLARQAASLAGELAAARAAVERLSEDLERARGATIDASEELEAEWGANLEAARLAADKHPPETDSERARLARRLKRFGDVNLLALSQEQELRERHEFIATQRADADAAAGELEQMISVIDREIEARFAQTFGRVKDAFGEMVPRMMQGASGILELSEEGIEVGLRLGRRGWKPLRVLSGGERALLALSFLFSIFLSRPGGDAGAFCVLDEAEAALDDLNLARFLAVVDSHRTTGQYLLVTHQKRTMAAADVLYGVVQDSAGATTVVSKRMQGE